MMYLLCSSCLIHYKNTAREHAIVPVLLFNNPSILFLIIHGLKNELTLLKNDEIVG